MNRRRGEIEYYFLITITAILLLGYACYQVLQYQSDIPTPNAVSQHIMASENTLDSLEQLIHEIGQKSVKGFPYSISSQVVSAWKSSGKTMKDTNFVVMSTQDRVVMEAALAGAIKHNAESYANVVSLPLLDTDFAGRYNSSSTYTVIINKDTQSFIIVRDQPLELYLLGLNSKSTAIDGSHWFMVAQNETLRSDVRGDKRLKHTVYVKRDVIFAIPIPEHWISRMELIDAYDAVKDIVLQASQDAIDAGQDSQYVINAVKQQLEQELPDYGDDAIVTIEPNTVVVDFGTSLQIIMSVPAFLP